VDHKIVMNNLELYDIEGNFKTLIASYLTGRYKKATLINNTDNNSSSKWEMIKSDVPQGSILGPPLFLLYINDLPKIITKNNGMVPFADYTNLLITGFNKSDFNFNINQSFRIIISWSNSNLLSLNFNKTQYVEFRTKNYQVKTAVKYEHKDIFNSTETKFLGLIIDEKLFWNQHIDRRANKLCSACYALRKLKHFTPLYTRTNILYLYTFSFKLRDNFGGRSSNSNKIFILQKKIIRIITSSRVR
jgi:hypothetical protein